MNLIKLFDPLIIKNGVNIAILRFTAQFTCNQSTLNRHIKDRKIFMSRNLLLSAAPPTDNEERI